jgi:hypothetical protein
VTQTRNWIVVLVAAALATGVAVVGRAVNRDEIDRACAGVGISTGTSGSTPDEAFAAYIESLGGQPGHWEPGAEFGEHGNRPIDHATALPDGYSEIHVRKTGGIWRVEGACVAPPEPG